MTVLTARNVSRQLRDGEREFKLTIENLRLGPGDRKAIVGPSGCGKTTAMDLLALASRPDTADVLLLEGADGTVDAAALLARGRHGELSALRARYFGYVLQTSALFPFLTVGENIELSQRFAGRREPELVDQLLEALGIPNVRRAWPDALSVGQRQRVAVARALAHRPAFLLADEPTAALDPTSARTTLGICLEVMAIYNGSMLIITHDLSLAREMGFDIVELEASSSERSTIARVDDRKRAS